MSGHGVAAVAWQLGLCSAPVKARSGRSRRNASADAEDVQEGGNAIFQIADSPDLAGARLGIGLAAWRNPRSRRPCLVQLRHGEKIEHAARRGSSIGATHAMGIWPPRATVPGFGGWIATTSFGEPAAGRFGSNIRSSERTAPWRPLLLLAHPACRDMQVSFDASHPLPKGDEGQARSRTRLGCHRPAAALSAAQCTGVSTGTSSKTRARAGLRQ